MTSYIYDNYIFFIDLINIKRLIIKVYMFNFFNNMFNFFYLIYKTRINKILLSVELLCVLLAIFFKYLDYTMFGYKYYDSKHSVIRYNLLYRLLFVKFMNNILTKFRPLIADYNSTMINKKFNKFVLSFYKIILFPVYLIESIYNYVLLFMYSTPELFFLFNIYIILSIKYNMTNIQKFIYTMTCTFINGLIYTCMIYAFLINDHNKYTLMFSVSNIISNINM